MTVLSANRKMFGLIWIPDGSLSHPPSDKISILNYNQYSLALRNRLQLFLIIDIANLIHKKNVF